MTEPNATPASGAMSEPAPPCRYRLSAPERAALAQIRKQWDMTWADVLSSRGHEGPAKFSFHLDEGWVQVEVER